MVLPVGMDIPAESTLAPVKPRTSPDLSHGAKDQDRFTGQVLVAEDSPANQKLIGLHLKRLGLQATIVDNGKKAVDAVADHDFDLIFMDMQMPEMNGYDATRALRAQGETLPIVALTAYAMEEDDKKCYDAGCDDYLAKPMDRNKLIDVIRKYLPNEQDASERDQETMGSSVLSSPC
jgi:CheY-like chemotaxis protein